MKNTKGVKAFEQEDGTCFGNNSTCNCSYSCCYTENLVYSCISMVERCIFYSAHDYFYSYSIYILLLTGNLEFTIEDK